LFATPPKWLKVPPRLTVWIGVTLTPTTPHEAPAVLFVDDEPEVTEGIARAFRRERFRVYTANSVADAQALLARERVHVVVSDEQMPEMRGSAFLTGLRTSQPEVTRILLTGHGDLDTVKAALNEAEIFRFLTKPCRPDDLRTSVEDALAAHARYLAWSDTVERDATAQRLSATFDTALSRLWLAAQPIVTTGGRAVAWECLARVATPDFRGPVGLFTMARDLDRTSELERAVLARVADLAHDLPIGHALFCNIEAETLLDDALYDPSSPLSLVADRVVIEVTERAPLTKIPALQERVARLRALGFRLALDDFGAGAAGFSALANLRPDVVKFDMDLIRGIEQDATKERTVAMLLELCKGLGAQALGEGVETTAERDKLRELGFDLLQGYLFGRPDHPFPPVLTAP
jgi:EAL domain-containing protein (putative c-di-GMP-specific phosphodiesterase class I)